MKEHLGFIWLQLQPAPLSRAELGRNSKLTQLSFPSPPPQKKKVEKLDGNISQHAARRFRCSAERAQTWLILPRTEMFWHVYLFNLFILTSSDYNWQQWAALTLGSVLDLSVTIMQKAFEAKSSEGVTRAGVWFSKKTGRTNRDGILSSHWWRQHRASPVNEIKNYYYV